MLGARRKLAVVVMACSALASSGAAAWAPAPACAGAGEQQAPAESPVGDRPSRPAIKPHYLGAVPDPSDRSGAGARIQEVQPGSPAAQAGLRPGDVITAIGSARVRSPSDLDMALRTTLPGQPVELVYDRDGKEERTQVTLIGRR